jgi:hypothetical protein
MLVSGREHEIGGRNGALGYSPGALARQVAEAGSARAGPGAVQLDEGIYARLPRRRRHEPDRAGELERRRVHELPRLVHLRTD